MTESSVLAIEAQKRLVKIWATGILLPFLLLFAQTVTGLYGENVARAWAWFASNVTPTLSLAVASLIAEGKRIRPRRVPAFLARLSVMLSVGYLFAILVTLLVRSLTGYAPSEWLLMACLYLGPLQALLAGVLGYVLVGKDS